MTFQPAGASPPADVIAAVVDAVDTAVTALDELGDAEDGDPDEAFTQANALSDALEKANIRVGKLRARLAARIAQREQLDLETLATRLTRPGRTIGKSRAGQLLQAAARAAETEQPPETPREQEQ